MAASNSTIPNAQWENHSKLSEPCLLVQLYAVTMAIAFGSCAGNLAFTKRMQAILMVVWWSPTMHSSGSNKIAVENVHENECSCMETPSREPYTLSVRGSYTGRSALGVFLSS